MDIDSLQLFIEVMRHHSFAVVARERGVDPSIVSRAIASLEQQLGVRLFHRNTRKLTPTDAGLRYFQQTASAIDTLQQANTSIADSNDQPSGILRLTASASFGQRCIVPNLPRFTERYPNLTLDLLLTDNVVDLISERIDLAIRLGSLHDSSLVAQRMMQTRYIVCASPEYLRKHPPIKHPEDIGKHRCLLFQLPEFRTHWRFRLPKGKWLQIAVKGSIFTSNAIALEQCAVLGMGLSLLPHWLVRSSLASGSLVNVLPRYEVTAGGTEKGVWCVYPSRNQVPTKVRVMMEHLKECLME